MGRKENEWRAKRIVQFHQSVSKFCKKNTVEHFLKEGIPKPTIYRVLAMFEESGDTSFKKLPGRPPAKSSPRKVVKVEKVFRRDPNTSVRAAAKKLNLSKSTVSNIKVHRLRIKAYTKKKSPMYTLGQEARAKTGLRKIYKKTLEKVLIIDDETYVPFDPSQIPGRQFFHAYDQGQLEFDQKFKSITKFAKKYLVWVAMDEEGRVSEPYISDGTMTADVYISECLKKRLLPFIHKYHDLDRILFWPDLATCHYANRTQDYLNSKNVNFVPKNENPPNVPQARGIEEYWGVCKKKYSNRQDKPKNLQGFKLIWNKILKEAAGEVGIQCMERARRMIRSIGYKGVRGAMCDITNKRS